MKILIITPTIAPHSGAGRYSKAVLEEYKKQGIDYVVLTEAGGKEVDPFEKRAVRPLKSISSLLFNLKIVRKMAKDCTIVHAFDGWPYAIYGYAAVLFSNKKLFINAVGTYAVAALKTPIKGIVLTFAYRRAVSIFAISEFVKNNVLKYRKLNNLSVVYLGTTPMKKPEENELEAFKLKYGIQSQTPIILTVGALKDRKGQYETVEAISILKNKYPDILYCIVGSLVGNDSYVHRIKEYVRKNKLENNVKIISDAGTDKSLSCAYELSDIFILPSKYDPQSEHSEGFGLVLLEAAQFGKPVIGSKGSGIPEAMEDGVNGYLVDEVTPKTISETIEKVISNYEVLARNSKKVSEKYSWERTATSYIAGYRKVEANKK
jgi:glycosyltransferase involved in cell wall biosynthesis